MPKQHVQCYAFIRHIWHIHRHSYFHDFGQGWTCTALKSTYEETSIPLTAYGLLLFENGAHSYTCRVIILAHPLLRCSSISGLIQVALLQWQESRPVESSAHCILFDELLCRDKYMLGCIWSVVICDWCSLPHVQCRQFG